MERSPSISGDSENDFFGKNPVLSMPPTAIFNSCVWLIPNTCHWCLLFRMCHCPNNSFFKWANSGLFLLIFVLFKHKFYRKNCRLQRDSNLDHRSRRRSRPKSYNVAVILVAKWCRNRFVWLTTSGVE